VGQESDLAPRVIEFWSVDADQPDLFFATVIKPDSDRVSIGDTHDLA